jgi:hypothetical protein
MCQGNLQNEKANYHSMLLLHNLKKRKSSEQFEEAKERGG